MFRYQEPLILLQTVKEICEGVLFLVKLQALPYNFSKK